MRLLGDASIKGGVCNKCSLLNETLMQLQTHAQRLLPPNDLERAIRVLQEVRLHVFHGGVVHASGRAARCQSHNTGWALGGAEANAVRSIVADGVACQACQLLEALAGRLVDRAGGINSPGGRDLRREFRLAAYFIGHNALKADARHRLKMVSDAVDTGDGTNAVLYLDLMMRVLEVVKDQSKQDWYGQTGWNCEVAAAYCKVGDAGQLLYVLLESEKLLKVKAEHLLALLRVTLQELRKIVPAVARLAVVLDDGSNFSGSEYITRCAAIARLEGCVALFSLLSGPLTTQPFTE